MFEAFREKMGRRALDAAVLTRSPRPLSSVVTDRSALLVLPTREEDQRPAWSFVESIDLPLSHLTTVVVSDRVAYVPDRFAGSVKRVTENDLDWRGLPRAEVLVDMSRGADVAIDLSVDGALATQFIVGTSSAPVRIGRYHADSDAYYDLMLAGSGSTSELVAGLRHTLERLDPPVLPLR